MAIESDYQKIKERAKKLTTDIARAEGEMAGCMKQMAEEFECESIEDARDLLGKLHSQYEEAKADHEQAMEIFVEKWGDLLNA